MFGWHHRVNGHEFEQTPGDSKGQGSLACCSPWGCKGLDMTLRLNNNNRGHSATPFLPQAPSRALDSPFAPYPVGIPLSPHLNSHMQMTHRNSILILWRDRASGYQAADTEPLHCKFSLSVTTQIIYFGEEYLKAIVLQKKKGITHTLHEL